MGFHWYELAPLAVLALLVFGPKRLPELGGSIGKTIREFQKSIRDVPSTPDSPSALVSPQPLALPPVPLVEATQSVTTSADTPAPPGA